MKQKGCGAGAAGAHESAAWQPVGRAARRRHFSLAHQGYALGAVFVSLHVLLLLVSVGRIAETVYADYFVRFVDLYQAIWSSVAGVAALRRSSWRWHILITALPVDVAARLLIGIQLGVFGQLRFTNAVILLGWIITDGLWFSYFYRRRAMFAGTHRWSWLERYVPIIIGPDRYEAPHPALPPLTSATPRVVGLSQRGAILLAAAGTIAFLLLYALIANTWLRSP